jgi:cytochrome P450
VTLRVILELVLGVRDAALRERLTRIFDWLNSPLTNLAIFLPERLNRRSRWNLLNKPAYDRLDQLHTLLGEHIARTRSDPQLEQRTDVLSLMLRARVDGQALSDTDLRDELLTLVSAGHETTATAIAWASDLLAHNPKVLGEYLKATAKEVLRARTVAYISAGRYALEPFPIGDHVLGPEVAILVDAQGVHGDPEVYPEPEAFRPERFLDGAPDGYAYIPFGGGTHRCLGASLAMLELELFIEALAGHVSLSPAGPPAQPRRRSVTLAPDNGGRVYVSRVPASALVSA